LQTKTKAIEALMAIYFVITRLQDHKTKRQLITEFMLDIDLNEYNYELPEERIAQYPVIERDSSKLLIYKHEKISQDIFKNISQYIPSKSLLVFNNTRVIRARLLFRKETGAQIEILCLEPHLPFEYESSFGSFSPVEWKCIVGNLKKWKNGLISTSLLFQGQKYELTAQKLKSEDDVLIIKFSWNCHGISFGDVIESAGHIPLPPYINREDEAEDIERYQTIYSSIKGSVAAPTAGLHFSDRVFHSLKEKGIKSVELTLHVGAGTFQPVKTQTISGHEMHCEHFSATFDTINSLLENHGNIIAVGTTSVRTLESLYWLGARLARNTQVDQLKLVVGQWDPYSMDENITVKESIMALIKYMSENRLKHIHGSTSLIIIPQYTFRMIEGIITNFHQPKSTLLLLISAWMGQSWKKVYSYALENQFRFLSYGDSSLLLR
jgi:S-adenosylmethionine:tRNA ribosyltransferase-isomerase